MNKTETLTGYAAAMVTAQMTGDSEGFELLLDSLPRPLGRVLPHLVADAAVLMRDSAYASVSMALHRLVDNIDLVAVWRDCCPSLQATLAHLHGFEPADLDDWLGWAEAVLLQDDTSVPVADHARFLVLTTSLISEEWAGYPPEEWQRFLLGREADNDCR